MSNGEVKVGDDGERAFHQDTIDTLLHADPAEFARLIGQDPGRVRVILERMSEPYTPDADTPLSAVAHGVLPYGRLALVQALRHLPAEAALRLFDETNLLDLIGRWALVPYLLADALFLKVDELAEVLEEFADHLEDNRSSLVRRGVPDTTLGASWPGMVLSYLYPTKSIFREDSPPVVDGAERTSPRDRALKHMPASKRATRVHTYFWIRRGPSESGEYFVMGGSPEAVARIFDLDEQTAARVEEGRSVFLDLEIDVLRTLANALRAGDAETLWDQCLKLLTDALLADDATFYLEMDQWGYGYDIASGKGERDGYLTAFPGGLSHLLMVIGYAQKELTIGTMDRTKRLMPLAVFDDDGFHSYFEAVCQPWHTELDHALDQFVELGSHEAAFWTDYRERVNEAIENEFSAEFVFRAKVKQKLAENARFEPFVRSFIDLQREHLLATGLLAPVSLGSSATPPPPVASTRTIRTDKRVRTFAFDGREVHLRDSKGLRYLTQLLLHPDKDIHVLELVRLVDHPSASHPAIWPGALDDAYDDLFQLDQGEGTGPALDRDAKDAYRDRARQIPAELSEARDVGDEDKVQRLLEELQWIEIELTSAVGRRGRDRPKNADAERARSKISKQVNEAIGQIEDDHPGLCLHLKSVRLGVYCGYHPGPDQLPWTLL